MNRPSDGRRPTRRASLRLRITAGALIVAVGALTGAGLLVLEAVQHEMTEQIDRSLRADADFTRRLLVSGAGLPTKEGPTDLYVQFIADDGRVLGAGTAAEGRPALAPGSGSTGRPAGGAATAPGADGPVIVDGRDDVLGELRVLAVPVPGNEHVTLVLARSSADVAAVRASLVRLLSTLVLLGSVLLAALVWMVVGRSLRPVEEMRLAVNGLDDRHLRTRVARPGTGDELDRLAGTLNDLLDRLDDAVARERRFVADASHELRTPIAGLRALLETEVADPDLVVLTRADALARLADLQALAEQLLVLARLDAVAPASGERGAGTVDGGTLGLPAAARAVDVDDLVLLAADHLRRTTTLRIDTSRVSGGQASGRDADLARVVENLAANASRFAATTVSFAVREGADHVELVVDDDGPGVPVEAREAVFERFRVLDDARGLPRPGPGSDRSGSGLGLAIVAAIVANHRGSVEVDDAPGGGARVRVHLPRWTATPAAPRPGDPRGDGPGLRPVGGRGAPSGRA